MKVGIIGLPNVGKSTLFNAITNMQVLEANYPFATIEPNIGNILIEDQRLNHLAKIFQSKKIIKTKIEFVDIAGLVENASKGEGLGNKFLGHIRNVDALCLVVKCFQNENIIHIREQVDPIKENNIIETELILSDLEQIEKSLSKRNNNKKNQEEIGILTKLKINLENEINISEIKSSFSEKELKIIKNFNLLSFKPMIYVGNFQEEDIKNLENNYFFQNMLLYSEQKKRHFIPVCILLEKELSILKEKEKKYFLETYNFKKNNLQEIIQKSYEILGLKTYFTTGKNETRAWTFKTGMTASECGKIIHTDFQKGFIKAEVFNYQDLKKFKNLTQLKEKGKLRLEGRNYLVQDGDIITFYFNV